MPLTDEAAARQGEFKREANRLWEHASRSMPGLQCISTSAGTQVAIACPAVGEGAIVAQLPRLHVMPTGSRRNPVMRDAPDARKPPSKRAIMLTMRELDAILAAWKSGRSASTVPGPHIVYAITL